MSCKRKTKNTAAQTSTAASVSTVFAVPEADEAGETAVLGTQTELAGETAEADGGAGGTSPWTDVSMSTPSPPPAPAAAVRVAPVSPASASRRSRLPVWPGSFGSSGTCWRRSAIS